MTDIQEFGESAANAVLERIGRGVSKVQERRPLAYDLLESDDAYLVVFDAPGVTRDDVQVRFLDNEVKVQIDRFREFREGFEMRLPGRSLSLSGSAQLPADAVVDPMGADATLTKSGTLKVRIPKGRGAGTVAVSEEDESEREADADGNVGGDEGEGVERAESDVIDAVTDRDLDSPAGAGSEGDDAADEYEATGGEAVDEEAGDYGGAVTGDETNTGGVDVEGDADAGEDEEDGDDGTDRGGA